MVLRLECTDRVAVLEREADVIPAVEQPFAAQASMSKRKREAAVSGAHQLLVEIDRQLEAGERARSWNSPVNLRLWQSGSQAGRY